MRGYICYLELICLYIYSALHTHLDLVDSAIKNTALENTRTSVK